MGQAPNRNAHSCHSCAKCRDRMCVRRARSQRPGSATAVRRVSGGRSDRLVDYCAFHDGAWSADCRVDCPMRPSICDVGRCPDVSHRLCCLSLCPLPSAGPYSMRFADRAGGRNVRCHATRGSCKRMVPGGSRQGDGVRLPPDRGNVAAAIWSDDHSALWLGKFLPVTRCGASAIVSPNARSDRSAN